MEEPMTLLPQRSSQACLIFRCILKIAGGRNSRFPEVYHRHNIVRMCCGLEPLDNELAFEVHRKQITSREYVDDLVPQIRLPKISTGSEREVNMSQQIATALMNDDLQQLRDEVWLQLAKQINDNSKDK